MERLEKNPDSEVGAESKMEAEEMRDNPQEADTAQESTPESDAFDITRRFKHGQNQIPTAGQAAREPQAEEIISLITSPS